ncbi:MAG: hypothetical protein FJ276_02205 [Planctomycetes bacterium]|nr:hypothetical protein [Planctomycetota bacterium]
MLKGAPDATVVQWSRKSGPGTVTFADAASPATTATFSQLGDYLLELTARTGTQAASSALQVKVIPAQPANPWHALEPVPFKVDSPFWNERVKTLIVNWIPHCVAKISDPELKDGGINNFIDAANALAGKPHGQHRGYVFSNAWVHNTVEAMCVALMIDPRQDPQIIAAQNSMRATLEDWIPKILAAQEPDGYLQTAFTLSDRQRWSPRHRGDHEGYVAGYFLDAAVAHHVMTGGSDTRLYDAARHLADCWDAHLGPPPKKEWYDGHQAMEIGLMRFGRYVNQVEGNGRGDRYIALARFLLDCRRDGSEYDQSHLPVTQQYEAVGHAVRAVYSYAGMADVAMETGDVDYQSAVMSLWHSIVNRKYYVTGGVGSGETPEGFGPEYSLRHNGYCESCSSCGEIFFQHKLNLIHHDAQYADLVEETLYNALLGSVDLEGKNFYYDNPLNSNRARYDWHVCPCCVGNIPRTLLMLPTWMYVKDDAGICVNLFIGSTVTLPRVAGTDVQLVQATDYPQSGDVSLTVNPSEPKDFSVRVRVPNGSVSELYTSTPASEGVTDITVNGQPVAPVAENGYIAITRRWQAGDVVRWKLSMPIQRIKGIDKIQATVGQTALRRGPLIYCFESVDQELDQVLPPDLPLAAEWDAGLLGGVPVIRGQWPGGSPLLAIPYSARNNRGGRSIVWVRDQ